MLADIFEAAGYSALFLGIGLGVLALSYWVLDLVTPGHKLGDRLLGKAGGASLVEEAPSYGAAVVAGAWMLMQGAIIWRALWTNAVGDDLSDAVVWSVLFSLVGVVLQAVGFLILDLFTPGRLGDEVCAPGRARPLSYLAAANIAAVGLIVIAVIS